MRVAIVTVRTPFVHGGGELLADGLQHALRLHGHDTDIVTMPFAFDHCAHVRQSMARWRHEVLDDYNEEKIDRAICLKFPAYYVQHPNKVLWLLHQHRTSYELWDEDRHNLADERGLRDEIMQEDTRALAAIRRRFTISRTVRDRLRRYNGLAATALYHPPPQAEQFYRAPDEMYIWCPSRLESLKRQALLIEAMMHVKPPVVALIAGTGGQKDVYQLMIDKLGLQDRVKLLGAVDRPSMLAGYAMSLAVFFGPQDEDYGYVTLEAMLAGKPVITCTDSGGSNEFVVDGETGFVTNPEPQAIAAAINRLAHDRARASAMGYAGRDAYAALNIGWDQVVEQLLG